MQVIRNLFRKNRFQEGDILYLQRRERKTLIYLTDGRVISTYEPLKNVLTELSPEVFESINKGIVVNHAFIARDVDGYVLLTDGSGFTRRKKPLKKKADEVPQDPQEQTRRNLEVLSGQAFRSFMEEKDRQYPAKSVLWKDSGDLWESVTYESSEGCWVTVEFTASDHRVFTPREEQETDGSQEQ